MKKIIILIIACVALSATKSNAQGLGLPDLGGINKNLQTTLYQEFLSNGSNYMLIEAVWIDVLKLPSITTFGGYSVSVEKTTDMVSKKSAKAIKFRPNSGTTAGKFLSGATRILSANESRDYFIDATEVPQLIAKLKEFQALAEKPTNYTCSYNYICKGGLTISVGYRKADADKKESVWMGSIAGTGDMVLKDILGSLISMVEKANEQLAKM